MDEDGNADRQHKISKLVAELSILRANYSSIERENSQLKMERAKLILSKSQMEESLKRKLELQQKENKIVENQKKYFRVGTTDSVDLISPKFALIKALAGDNFGCEENLKKMRFFRDYFFDDFYSLESDQLFGMIENAAKFSTKQFLELFTLFSCKRDVFVKFCRQAFENSLFLPLKTEVLDNIPPEWAVDMLETHLKRFVAENKKALGVFICNIAAKCPLSLQKIFDQGDFEDALSITTPIHYQIVYEICRNRIQGYVDETNIHLVPRECLRLMFRDDYFDPFL